MEEIYDEPLTPEWVEEHVDTKSELLVSNFSEITTEKNEKGHFYIQICFRGEFYWELIFLGTNKWYVTLDSAPDTDSWMPDVKTIGDFFRLFKVATGIYPPMKKLAKTQISPINIL